MGAVPCIWFRRLGRPTDGLQASPGRARAKELAALEEKRRINSRTKRAPSACTVSVAAASTLRKVDASDPPHSLPPSVTATPHAAREVS